MTAPTQPPTRETMAEQDQSKPPMAELTRFEIKVTPQPNVTLFNGDEQTPISMSNKITGEVVSFGKRLGERTFDNVMMVLTCDMDRGVWWILVIDVEGGGLWQNGYLIEHAENAFSVFAGASPAEVRATLMVDSPSN